MLSAVFALTCLIGTHDAYSLRVPPHLSVVRAVLSNSKRLHVPLWMSESPQTGFEEDESGPSEDFSREMDEMMKNELQENAPSDLQVRMNLMGFTPVTIVGYAVAGILICLNYFFGYGWASDVLGLDGISDIEITRDSENIGNNIGRGDRQLQLDDKLMKIRDDGVTPIRIDNY
jgi:hypothetical protein